MDKSPFYKRFLLACLLTLVFSLTLNVVISKEKEPSIDIKDIPGRYMTIEGYVVSKRIDAVWISDEPISIWERLPRYFISSYGSGSTFVSKHSDVENQNIFNELKVNQKVRVYGDYLRESNPSQISAYYIEVINNG
ncbi:DUF3221 domain-containing protein [Lentibacillus sp. CBA3610]|uniref:DUF3221 domain-containing protein n=1 Tax=Lentibacillus sp. CBA3610 TaxID=2518176 RepID=UPI001595365E|nr:DUF3221 domain-containing protein [Lentibacillus sp. CBA3610]